MLSTGFNKKPEYSYYISAEQKLYQLAERDWRESVNPKAIRELFKYNLGTLQSLAINTEKDRTRDTRCRLAEPLFKIASILAAKVGTSPLWKNSHKEVFVALGAAHCFKQLRTPETQRLPLFNLLQKEAIQTIFSMLIKNRTAIRLVCKAWKIHMDFVWNRYCEDHQVTPTSKVLPDNIEDFFALNSRIKFLDLSELQIDDVITYLHMFPQLKVLKVKAEAVLKCRLDLFASNLECLVIENALKRNSCIDLSKYRKLKEVEVFNYQLFLNVKPIILPQTIEKCYLKNCDISKIRIPPNASVQKLWIYNCQHFSELNTSVSLYDSVKEIDIINCPLLNNVVFRQCFENLTSLQIQKSKALNLDFSRTSFPQLSELTLTHHLDVTLPPACLAPKLKSLWIDNVRIVAELSLERFSMLEKLTLFRLNIKAVWFPVSINKFVVWNIPSLKALHFADNSKELKVLDLYNVSLKEIDLSKHPKLFKCSVVNLKDIKITKGPMSFKPKIIVEGRATYINAKKHKP